MSDNDQFISILELLMFQREGGLLSRAQWLSEVGDYATIVEKRGCYGTDRFGRFRHSDQAEEIKHMALDGLASFYAMARGRPDRYFEPLADVGWFANEYLGWANDGPTQSPNANHYLQAFNPRTENGVWSLIKLVAAELLANGIDPTLETIWTRLLDGRGVSGIAVGTKAAPNGSPCPVINGKPLTKEALRKRLTRAKKVASRTLDADGRHRDNCGHE